VSPPAAFRVGGAVPILRVKDLERSLRHYVAVLGFQVNWHARGIMASVSRGGATLMLCEGHQGQPGTWVWIDAGDAEALHEEYRARDAAIRLPPTNYKWAQEFHIQDPDGHVLRFGSDPKPDRPFVDWVEWYREG
jgi:catechol 2,3-dioxygenase-like lactoylglutathione lyase family enzyme